MQFKESLSTQLQLIKKVQNEQKGEHSEKTPPTTNLEEDWVLVHGTK